MNSPSAPRRGFFAWLWQRPRRWFLLGIPAGGAIAFLVGVGVTAGSFGALAFTASETFCTSCHEMRAPLSELANSTHYSNQLGIRAGCADCHIPPAFVAGVVRHMESGIKDAWGHVRSDIDTPAKYEAHRLDMAKSVWKELKANDSAECRSCHTPAAMAFTKQPAAASSSHQSLPTSGMTCIDCHTGIAHVLPQGS